MEEKRAQRHDREPREDAKNTPGPTPTKAEGEERDVDEALRNQPAKREQT